MLSKPAASRVIASASRATEANKRQFSASTSLRAAARNRIYTSVRTPDEFHTLNLLSSSSNRPLITLWTSGTCSSCKVVAPLVRGLIENEGVGEKEGGLGYAEIEMDSTLIEDLPFQLMINSIPTMLAFSRGEPQMETKVTKLEDLKDRQFLTQWLQTEAARRGQGGAGGGLTSIFGSLFR